MILEDIKKWPLKLEQGAKLATEFYTQYKDQLPQRVTKIAFLGMGGSGVTGRILKTFLDQKSKVTTFIVDTPDIPPFLDNDTLIIASTYSGNTWETLSGLQQAVEKGLPTMVLAHGGRAQQLASERNVPFLKLAESVTPRSALGTFMGILLTLFDDMGLYQGKALIQAFSNHAQEYMPAFADASYFDDFLTTVSDLEFFHTWGISGESAAFAYRAQTQFNENSKVQAVTSFFPELCHNLLVGFTDIASRSAVLIFHTSFLTPNLEKAVEATSEILREKGVDLYKPPILGDTFEVQLFNMILWADFASCHLGKRRNSELTPVKIIDSLKQRHKQKGIDV